jgi:hypothetical protein
VVVYFREPKGHPEKWRGYLNFRTVADANVAKAAANPIILDGQDYRWTEYWRREDDVRTGAHAFRVRDAREQHRSRHARDITPATNAVRRSPENDTAGLMTATITSPRMRPSGEQRTEPAVASSVLSLAVAWTPASTCTSLDAAPTMTYASSTISTNVSTPVSGHTSLDVIYSSSSPGSEAAPLTSELVHEPLVCPLIASSTWSHPPEEPPSSISIEALTKQESDELGYIATLNADFPDSMSEEELDIRLCQPPVRWVQGNKILEMMVRCRTHRTLHQFCPVVVRRISTSVVVC